MGRESLRRNIWVLHFAKCPFVDDTGVSSVVEYAGGDPRLEARRVVNTSTQKETPKTYFEQ
jgi:hypothetical protein